MTLRLDSPTLASENLEMPQQRIDDEEDEEEPEYCLTVLPRAVSKRPMRPRGFFTLKGGLSLLTLLLAGCGSPPDDSSRDGHDSQGSGGQLTTPTFTETEGGDEVVPHESLQGTATLIGSSDAVPVSNRSFAGYRDPALDGSDLVRCSFYPDGSLDYPYPYAEVLVGIQGFTYYQAQAQMFYFAVGQEVSVPLDPDANLEDGSKNLIFIASLTHEAEEGAYRYWYGVDEYAFPPYGSTCSVKIDELSEQTLAGAISCADLIASPDSPDAPVTNAPYPTAQATLTFECPVVHQDPGGGQISNPPVGTCTGVPHPCGLLSSFECGSTAGCSLSGSCSGAAQSCSQYFEFYSCEYQDGCYWYGGECNGIPKSCYTYEDDLSCVFHSGCDWYDDCEGEAIPCAAFHTAFSCETQGCRWEE